jgi:hypothetical protein
MNRILFNIVWVLVSLLHLSLRTSFTSYLNTIFLVVGVILFLSDLGHMHFERKKNREDK